MKQLLAISMLLFASVQARAEHWLVPKEATEQAATAIILNSQCAAEVKHATADFYTVYFAAYGAGGCDVGSKRGRVAGFVFVRRNDEQIPRFIEFYTGHDAPAAAKELLAYAIANNSEFATMFQATAEREQQGNTNSAY